MITETSGLMPSTRRPVPLHRRADLIVELMEYQRGSYFVVKDPVALKYYRLGPEHYRILELLDGTRSLEEIRDELLERFPYVRPTLGELQMVVIDLHNKGLVYSGRPGQGQVMLEKRRETRKQQIMSTAMNILSLRFPGWDPERTLRWLYPWVRWMYRPEFVFLQLALIGAAYILLASQFNLFRTKLPEFRQFFGWPNLIYLYVTIGAMKVLHELGHGMTCRHFGGECHEIGVILLVFSPTLYCDVSDSWMLKNKWERIAIGAAGMWIESILSSLALFAWWFTHPGLLHHLCLNVFFISSVSTVVFNANPLMRYDGYYMLSDFLEIPNLAEKARRLTQDAFSNYCLGIETKEDAFMPQHGRFWLITYTIASTIYRWVVLFGITLFLYTVLKPYKLQSVGITMAWLSLGGIVGSMITGVVQIIRTPRNKPLSKPHILASLGIVAVVLGLVGSVPLPLHVYAPFLIEPHDVVHVYSAVRGKVVEIKVKPGDPVEKGDILMVLADPEKILQKQELETQLRSQEIEVEKLRRLEQPSRLEVALKQLESIRAQIADHQLKIDELTVRAPVSGKVVAPPRTPEPKDANVAFELHPWKGIPLDPQNEGALIEPRTHLCSIAPDDLYQAVLLVDQSDRNDLHLDQKVQIKFDHLPNRVFDGTINAIAAKHTEFAPGTVTNKAGGTLATVTDSQGRERLTSVAYEATVLLDKHGDRLCAGMRGDSRFRIGHRSPWDWLFRWYRHTFNFRL
ncbi:MAG: HlyD family efflux transporter periplasmic adaptor subunit [Planctomycetes bacterium]|nr:HlyD family efflux transporter periplasmic adaptor subunit [Planctomycetota bacterium]